MVYYHKYFELFFIYFSIPLWIFLGSLLKNQKVKYNVNIKQEIHVIIQSELRVFSNSLLEI